MSYIVYSVTENEEAENSIKLQDIDCKRFGAAFNTMYLVKTNSKPFVLIKAFNYYPVRYRVFKFVKMSIFDINCQV